MWVSMRVKTYFLSMFLVSTGLHPATSAETTHYGMKAISLVGATEKIVIADMPRTRDQGGYGICYAVIASTLIDHATCTTVKEDMKRSCVRDRRISKEIFSAMIDDENNNYCRNLAIEYSSSVFYVARFNNKPQNNSK